MKLHRIITLAALFAAGASSFALAQTLPPEKAFGAREAVTSASLSPDGKTMAFLAPMPKQSNALFTVPVDGSAEPKRALVATGDPERLLRCSWVANDRLVCNVYALREESGFLVGMTRSVAVDAQGGNVKLITPRDAPTARYFSAYGGRVIDWLPGQDGALLMSRWHVPESKIGSLVSKSREGLGVDRVDTRTLDRKTVLAPMTNAGQFITDGAGNVRIAGIAQFTAEYTYTGVVKYMHRAQPGADWLDLGKYDTNKEEGFNPLAVDSASNLVFGLQKENGRAALVSRSLDGPRVETTLFSRPDVDIDGPIRLGRKGRVIGATFATEKRQSHYFDPAMQRLATSLSNALPGSPLINFEGASDDEQKLLIWAGSDTDPGRYYLLDRGSKQMRPLLLSRPEVGKYKLSPVKAVQVKASDGTLIPAYLTLPAQGGGKGLPAIVMPHGGPSARDEWGFDWLAQYFAQKGYAVLQPNYRGSSGYGDTWFQNNGFKSWRSAISDVADSGRWLIAEGIADPSKLAIFGWSYGGYAALQSAVVAPDLFKAVVAVAPVTDFAQLRKEAADTSYHKVTRDFIGSGPHLREGSPAQNADAIKAPVMLFHGELDANVRVASSRLMADKLRDAGKRVQMTLYPKLDHYLEDSEVRADMLGKSDAFLRSSMGLK